MRLPDLMTMFMPEIVIKMSNISSSSLLSIHISITNLATLHNRIEIGKKSKEWITYFFFLRELEHLNRQLLKKTDKLN